MKTYLLPKQYQTKSSTSFPILSKRFSGKEILCNCLASTYEFLAVGSASELLVFANGPIFIINWEENEVSRVSEFHYLLTVNQMQGAFWILENQKLLMCDTNQISSFTIPVSIWFEIFDSGFGSEQKSENFIEELLPLCSLDSIQQVGYFPLDQIRHE